MARPIKQVTTGIEALTKSEKLVLEILCMGMSNPEIGRELGIEATTVKGHLYKIYKKLGVTNCRAAIVRTIRPEAAL